VHGEGIQELVREDNPLAVDDPGNTGTLQVLKVDRPVDVTAKGFMAKIDAFFNLMFEQKASDLHLSSGNNPMLRINGELQRVDHPPLENDELKKMLYEIAPEYKIKVFEETGDVDFGYEIPNVSRFRANFFNQKYGIAAVFRQIPSKVLSFEDFEKFDAPLPAVLKKFACCTAAWWW
jgi:twitching motility protein PilT